MKTKYKILFSFLFFLIFAATLNADGEIIELETEKSTIDIENESVEATGRVRMKYGDIVLTSDNLKKIEGKNILFSYGNVVFNQGTQVIKAEQVIYDMDTNRAKILGSESYDSQLSLRFGGEETVSEYPRKITIKNGWFTTSPYEHPNYRVDADEIEIYPNRKLVAKNIGVNVKRKTWVKFPYYVASLRPANRRATLFPIVGSDSDRGYYGIWGFDYVTGPLLNGFVDFELSSKKKLALKLANDYSFDLMGQKNSGSVEVNRLVIPITGTKRNEWDFTLNHDMITQPKKDKADRKFLDFGYGNWNFNYRNTTTNLMKAVDGVELKDDYSDYVSEFKKIGFYSATINQELGRNGELNFNYFWTQDKDALRRLTEINDYIVDRDELDPRRTDVDLYRNFKYTNGSSDVLINIDVEDFEDVNPGYVGDLNSYRMKRNYLIDFKGPKIKLEYLNSDKDEYGELTGLKDRDDADATIFEKNNTRWVQYVAYDKKEEKSLTLGNYYPFRQNDYFGYEPKNIGEYLTNNLYFGMEAKQTEIQKKVYEYDFTRDNTAFNDFFLTPYAGGSRDYYNDDRIYKIYENLEYGRRAKEIIYEKYDSSKINIGNDKISLPIRDSYIGFNYSYEKRDYSKTYVPEFENGRKIEDVSSKIGYKVLKDVAGNDITKKPKVEINTIDTKLFTVLYDNTAKVNNKYDVKVTNEADITVQKVDATDAMYDGYDIIKVPGNVLGLKNDFKFYLGNVTLNYNFIGRDEKHFQDKWLQNRYVRNYVKLDVANKRFVSADFERNEDYEFKDFKNEEYLKREFQYGFVSNNADNFLYKYTDKNKVYYPYNTSLGWDQREYKYKVKERTFSINFNEWGLEYKNNKSTTNDIFGNSPTTGTPDLKLKTNFHEIGFVYDTSKMKNKKFESNHYFRVNLGTGTKKYRNINGTPSISSDDTYYSGKDYTTIGMLYRYENTAKPRYRNVEKSSEEQAVQQNNIENIETVQQSNLQGFTIENTETQKEINEVSLSGDNNIYRTTTTEQVFNSYVDEELNKQNKFDLNQFNASFDRFKNTSKYFQIGFDMELDESNTGTYKGGSGLGRINDFIFKVEAGYLEKFFTSYRFIMERPDRRYRDLPSRLSTYNYRRHDFQFKYALGKDPDKPWWIGTRLQYIQDGAPKSSDPEVYESSSAAQKVNKLTLALFTLSHRAENVQWEVGAGRKWDEGRNGKVGYYPVVTFSFTLTPFQDKGVQAGYYEGRPQFKIGM